MQEQTIDIPRISLSSSEKYYMQHRKCFKQCIKKESLNDPNLNNEQKACVKECLIKFKEMEIFMVEKMHKTMQKLILSDMRLKQTYMQQSAKQKKGS